MILDLRNVAVAAWLLAWSGGLAAYLASANGGYVDWCIPHLVGCDSISATGRHGWGFFIFKATILPAAGLTFVYWVLCYRWLNLIVEPARTDRVILALGLVGTAFLVLYVTFLGSEGETYRYMRRYGTVAYFGCTFRAQLLFAKRIIDSGVGSPIVTWKDGLASFMFIGALTFATMANFFEDEDFLQNI